MAWHQFSVVTDESTAPNLADYFSELGAVSVTFIDASDEPLYEPKIDQTIIWTNTKVIALFELDADPHIVSTLVFHQFVGHPLLSWSTEVLLDQSWERAWMEYFKPMKFSNKLWICPTGQERNELGTISMVLDPGLAFGTGTHPTTALCLEWLANQDLHNKVIIDYGCGSGILAVAALLLGAKHAHVIDIDPQALTASHYNAEKNHVQNRMSYYLPEDFACIQAEVVIANILAKPLIELSSKISGFIKPSGSLILSGILKNQSKSVIDAYREHGILFSRVEYQEDWCRLDAD